MIVEAAALQLASAIGEVDDNLRQLGEVASALGREVDLVVAPELHNTGYDLDFLAAGGADLAEPRTGPTVSLIADLARELGATFVVGFLEAGEAGRVYDSAAVVAPTGVPMVYRKTHLYPPEEARFEAGGELTTADTSAGRLGVMICFEHAFPEIATSLALAGAQVLAVPSAVPVGYEHVLTLRTRARAQDNQVFVVAANQADNGFCGRSLIAGPRGEVIADAGTEPTVLRASLDLSRISEERDREPSLKTRRPDLYA